MDAMTLAQSVAAQRAAALARLRPTMTAAAHKAEAIRDAKQERQEALTVQQTTNNLLRYDIPGYFPTPPALAARLCEIAALRPGLSVLEPSAGTGNIADAIRRCGCEPVTVEINQMCAQVLERKRYAVLCQDFLTLAGAYDRIIMNPPFERMQDVDHVHHAYDLLNPGGVLVAIVSESPFFREDRKATSFRAWLADLAADVETLPPHSFSSSGTDVNVKMIRIEK